MKFPIGDDLSCDLNSLVDTRLLIQANSGGGKSWCIRRILEQTFGHVQHLVIDPEGEFSSLRERYDYVLAAKAGGDTAADPRVAKKLAERLLELNASAILDIYELKAHERVRFVRLFLEALVDAPKKLWHPVLVVVDEAHVYCPQKGEAESAGAVIDLMTRGRKRGFCGILATQRLSKLHKDAAAEANNKLIGRTAQDIDMIRAADELGISGRDDRHELRRLEPGEFFAFGPALSTTVTRVHVGGVETEHPKAGARIAFQAPPPTERVRAMLPQLANLPAEAEAERESIKALKGEVTGLRRELASAKRASPPPDEAVMERRVTAAVRTATHDQEALLAAERRQHEKLRQTVGDVAGRLLKSVDGAEPADRAGGRAAEGAPPLRERRVAAPVGSNPTPPARIPNDVSPNGVDGLRSGAVRILRELACRYPLTLTRAQVGTLTGFTPSGGTFGTYIGDLRRRGYIEIRGQEVTVTEEGLEAAGEVPAAPATHDEVMALWRKNLRSGCYKLLEVIAEAGPDGISREDLALATEFTMSGGTFGTYLGQLRRNELVVVDGLLVVPAEILWPEELA